MTRHGWGLCRKEGRCVIADDLANLVEKMRQADVVVFATAVYYADVSESLRAFTDRLLRICTHEAVQLYFDVYNTGTTK